MGCIQGKSLVTGRRRTFSEDDLNPFLYYRSLASDPPFSQKTCLLLIDPQNDFVLPSGSLSVPGALADCDRVAKSLSENLDKVGDIFITLDTHQKYHIAHAMFWINAKGERPAPFTHISVQDVENRTWFAENEHHRKWSLEYVTKLKKGGRFELTIWPEHCLVGSQGHGVYEPLLKAIHEWEKLKKSSCNFILKGNNAFTEHYSAIKAEVEMDDDAKTFLNTNLIKQLKRYDRVLIAGEALSHCVNFTVRDLLANMSKEEIKRICVISDGSSCVTGFEQAGAAFMEDIKSKGVRFVPAAEAFA